MHLDTLKETLTEVLAIQAKAISGRSNIPVLSNVLLKADTQKLYFYTTNLEINIVSWIAADVATSGSTTVSIKRFMDYVGTLSSGGVKLEVKQNELVITSKQRKANFTTIPAEEFPKVSDINGEPLCTIASPLFFEAINQVAFSASKDETKPTFTGIFIEIKQNQIDFVSIDGFRLAKRTLTIETGIPHPLSFIVPSNYIEEIARLGGTKDEDVKIFMIGNKNQLGIRYKNSDFLIRLIDGTYPDYTRVIPQEFTTTIIINRQSLLDALKSSSIFASARDISIATFVIEEDHITIISSQKEIGESESHIDCSVKGETGKITYNAKFLQDALSHLVTDEVIMHVILNQDKPTVFFNNVEGTESLDESYLTLMTPIKN